MKSQLNTLDKRVVKTEKKITMAYINLLQQFYDMPGYITVTMVCQEAGINRTTFYKHYDTIEKLDEHVRNGLYEKYVKKMHMITPGNEKKYLIELLELNKKYFSENYIQGTAILEDILGEKLINESIRSYALSYDRSSIIKETNLDEDMLTDFVIAGTTSVIVQYMSKYPDCDLEVLADSILLLVDAFHSGLSNSMGG